MFMDTGIGLNAYSIIEQGRVSYLLQANSQERRNIFEEAAGISRFKARKKAALSRMAKTDQHLLHLASVIEEVHRRLHAVKVQAGKARRFTEYSEELRHLRVSVFRRDYGEEKQTKTEADAGLEKIGLRLTESESAIATLQTRKEEMAARLSCVERELEVVYAARARLETDTKLKEQATATAQRRIEELEEERAKYESNLREHLSRINGEVKNLEHLNEEASTSQTDVGARQERLGELEAGRAAVLEESADVDHRLRDSAAEVQDLFRQESALRNDIASLKANLANAETGLGRIATRLETSHERRTTLLEQVAQQRQSLDSLAESIRGRETRVEELAAAQKEKEDEIARLRDEISALRQRMAACQSRRETLEDLQRKREGVSSGVAAVLARRDEDAQELACVQGLLGDLVPVDAEGAVLLEAALGAAAEAVVVATLDDARRVLDYVRTHELGRVTCLVRDACQADEARSAQLTTLADALGVTDTDPVLRHVLGRFCVVDDLAAAAAAVARADRQAIVTRGGEVLRDGIWLTGGAGSAGPGIISRRAELAALEEEIGRIASAEEELLERHGCVEAERAAIEADRLRTVADAEEARSRRTELSTRSESLEEELAKLSDSIEADESELAELRQQADENRERLAARQEELAAVETRRTELETHRREETEAHEALRRRLEEADREIAAARVAIAQLAEKTAQLQRRIEIQKDALIERRSLVERARKEIDGSYSRQRGLQTQLRESEAEIHTFSDERKELEENLGTQETERGTLRSGILDIEDELRGKRALLREIEHEREAVHLEQQRCELQLESFRDRILEDYQIDLDEIAESEEGAEESGDVDWELFRGRIDELRQKIDRLGPVNMEALSELEEIQARSDHLEGQRADVEKARADLEEVIRRIDRISEERFRKTFNVVRTNFQEFFRKLFRGGKADVVLEDENNVLECGIEIIARPPGKEPRSISLLSGGEKALTTIALLFAILRSKPAPFVILDEVDAPLDETNIERFVNLVKTFLDHSQFIIISHSKRTMTMANCLYGVTMEEKGVSRKVEVQLEKYTPSETSDAPGEPSSLRDEDDENIELPDYEDAPIDEQIFAEAALGDLDDEDAAWDTGDGDDDFSMT